MILPVFALLTLLTLTNFSSPTLKAVEAILMGLLIIRYLQFDFISLKKIVELNRLLVFYLLLLFIAALRSNDPNVELTSAIFISLFLLLFFILFSCLAISYIYNTAVDSQKFIVNFIIVPYVLFFIVNFILFYLNINPSVKVLEEGDTGSAVLLSYFGFHVQRVMFPFSSGLNEYSTFCAGIFALSIWFFLVGRKYKFLILISIFTSALSLLLVDSRAALLYPIVIVAGMYMVYVLNLNGIHKNLKYLALVVVLGPLMYLYLLPALAGNSVINSALSRGSSDLATGDSRFTIWKIALNEFMDFKPEHIVGYGEVGQFGSRVSLKWAYLFSRWKDAEMKSPHSTVFSLIFDEGYLGLITYVAIVFQSLKRASVLWGSKPVTAGAIIVFMLYNIIGGISESLGGITLLNFTYLFLMIVITINTEYGYINKRQLIFIIHES